MSKRFILISLLLILISACTQQVTSVTPPVEEVQPTQPAPSNTVETESTPPTITSTPDLAATENALPPHPTFVLTITAIDTATAAFSICPGAPAPHAAIGNHAVVVAEDTDKLTLRTEPKISSDTAIRELEKFTKLQIVGGPVCVRETSASYWFWQVKVFPGGQSGWVADSDAQQSFIMVTIGQPLIPTPAIARTATPASACPGEHGPYGAGVQVTVIAGNSDKLKLRSEPKISPDTVLRELDQYTKLEIVGGPRCVTSAEPGLSYWLWKVKVLPGGKIGWVAEGDGQNNFIEPNNVPP